MVEHQKHQAWSLLYVLAYLILSYAPALAPVNQLRADIIICQSGARLDFLDFSISSIFSSTQGEFKKPQMAKLAFGRLTFSVGHFL